MRDPKRIPQILEEIRIFWEQNPDWRLGQLISNAHNYSSKHKADIFYVEDDDLMEGLRKLSDENT